MNDGERPFVYFGLLVILIAVAVIIVELAAL